VRVRDDRERRAGGGSPPGPREARTGQRARGHRGAGAREQPAAGQLAAHSAAFGAARSATTGRWSDASVAITRAERAAIDGDVST
jgi:hypothetical protein